MNDFHTAKRAAKELTQVLDLPSWKGSVFAWLEGNEFILKVCADRDWIDRQNIPSFFMGFRVETDEQIKGVAFG